jgi:hypothetical protein
MFASATFTTTTYQVYTTTHSSLPRTAYSTCSCELYCLHILTLIFLFQLFVQQLRRDNPSRNFRWAHKTEATVRCLLSLHHTLTGGFSLWYSRFDKNMVLDLPDDIFEDLISLNEIDMSSNLIRGKVPANTKGAFRDHILFEMRHST